MARRFLLATTTLTAALILSGCGGGGTSTTTDGTGGNGGDGGDTTTTGSGATGGNGGMAGSGGAAGAGGAPAVCGDGTLDSSEACDDGNVDPGDGCDASCAVEPGYQCAGSPSDCLTMCGDSLIAGAEVCDDGNDVPGDGCDADCQIEPGFMCTTDPPVTCDPICGDGLVRGSEACDDSNTMAGDGCSATCAEEAGFDCTGEPSACATSCGDGVIAGAETCDDGDAAPGDGCSAACAVEIGYQCTGAPSTCATVCGDGLIIGAETCDDSNAAPNDGCDAACDIEAGYLCVGEPSLCGTVCGDMIIAGAEACDDGDAAPNDGCNAMCAVETGYQCSGMPSACATICGDSLIIAAETCDDGNNMAGDGCSAACGVETGYQCSGLPSTCATVCGDIIIAGAETCDDGNDLAGDGCSAACVEEPGYYCSGSPSACITMCGDGIVAGTEQCDDGNQVNGDGCSANCTPNTGESCADPLLMLQANQQGGKYTWNIAAGGVGVANGAFACDPNGLGPDAVIAYTKTSDTLANGGQLLHIKADTPTQSTTTYYLNVEVTSGACQGGTSLKCLWYKDNWDSYLDVPPGTYYIWVAKNIANSGTVVFPQVTVVAEEIPAASAEGEGCWAPYTSMSSIYTPPAGAGLPHTWTVPTTINSFDMGPTWGEPGSISCDNTSPYGDIHGPDAVIQYDKVSPTSVLKIDVQNLDPTISQSDLDIEVLSVCDPTNPAKTSRNCRANKDTYSITAPSPAGPVYLWVSTEATGEDFNGAQVQVTEIFPGIGESWPTAEPLTGSGPVGQTSAQRLDAPSCFPAAGNIHWYKYTLINDAFSVKTNVAGTIGVYDDGGQERGCVADASAAPIAFLGSPGDTFYLAVLSPSTITSLTLQDVAYNGVSGPETDMQIQFPVSATSEYGMAVSPTELFMGDFSSVFAMPKTIGASAVQHGTADGITSTHLGYDLIFAGGNLFSVDSTTTTTASRLYRIYNGTTWGPTTWDTTPTYTASTSAYAITTDGTSLFMCNRRTTVSADFYTFSTTAPSAPTLLGTAPVWYVQGMAADTQYFYVASNGPAGEGVYRINRTNIAAPAVRIAAIDTGTLCNNIEIDSFTTPQYLYVRNAIGDVHAIVDPAGAAPVHVGAISTLGTSSDYAMTYDKAAGHLYFFETETDSAGRVVRLQ